MYFNSGVLEVARLLHQRPDGRVFLWRQDSSKTMAVKSTLSVFHLQQNITRKTRRHVRAPRGHEGPQTASVHGE